MSFPALRATFLGSGTSSGVPMIACECAVCSSADSRDKRLRSSLLISSGDSNIVIDTTPDFRFQMLRAHVKHLDAVIFTHPHKDHVAGLDDIRAFNYFQEQAIDVYANQLTEDALKKEFSYIFSDHKYPGVPDIKVHRINDEPFTVSGLRVTPIKAKHLRMTVLGFRFGDLTYLTDANFIEPEEKEKIRGSKILIVNALRREKHISHFTLDEAIALRNELEIPQAFFTHISHQLGLHAEVTASLPTGCALANDGLQLDLPAIS